MQSQIGQEELDRAIALEVWGLSEAQIDEWPWGVPEFSKDRNDAAGVADKMWGSDSHREAFERNLLGLIPKLHGGISELLFVCTPERICQAALKTVRECGGSKSPLPVDMNHPGRAV